jgi:hypothetical protein
MYNTDEMKRVETLETRSNKELQRTDPDGTHPGPSSVCTGYRVTHIVQSSAGSPTMEVGRWMQRTVFECIVKSMIPPSKIHEAQGYTANPISCLYVGNLSVQL